MKEMLILIPDDLTMDASGYITRGAGGHIVNSNGTGPERLFQEGMFLIAAGALLREHQQKTNGKDSK